MTIQQELLSKLDLLESDVQRRYAEVILSQSSVLYIEDKAGVGKSSILRKIATILGMQIIDLVISQVDEADLGIYPQPTTIELNGKQVKCFTYLPPEWAIRASERPTLVIFEELNRSTPEKRNACLQILNDYRVGQFELVKENVYFAASGNLGNEDGNDVDAFDNAMINRLCIIRHRSNYPIWKEEYGDKNVSKYIMKYLDSSNGTNIYDDAQVSRNTKDKKPFASHRSWSNLSKYIVSVHHKDPNDPQSDIKDWNKFKLAIKEIGHGYVGNSIIDFNRFLDNQELLSSYDVINNFTTVKSKLRVADTSDIARLLKEICDIKLKDLTDTNIDNIFSFLDFISEKELIATYVKDTFLKWFNDPDNRGKAHLIIHRPEVFSDKQMVSNFNRIYKKYPDIYQQALSGFSNDELQLKR